MSEIARADAINATLCRRCATRLSVSQGNTVEDAQCALCRGLFLRVDDFARLVCETLKGIEYETFWIGSRLEYGMLSRERELTGRELQPSEMLKVELNREIGKKVSTLTGKTARNLRPDVLAVVDTAFMTCQLEIYPLFIEGRYRKLIRGIPQTRWPCRRCHGKGCAYCDYNGKMYETSVEELIAAPMMEVFQAEEHFFHGMGREDIDAVMLGDGRPFVMELRNPKRRSADLAMLAETINQRNEGVVQVSNLGFTDREGVRRMKQASPSKTYRVVVRFNPVPAEEKLRNICSSIEHIMLKQRTPKRVVHRRADIIRERRIIKCNLERFDDEKAVMEIEAEAGTYIKEFITGDNGRTRPSLSEMLGVECIVETLDVMMVNGVEKNG
jgi:tRNA pseudouridine synthase 10